MKNTYYYSLVRSHDTSYTDKVQKVDTYWLSKGILAFDMEFSAHFVIGRLRDIKTASLFNVVVEKEGGVNDYLDKKYASHLGESRQIITALETITFYKDNRKN